ncbi:MAG: hypothetical protein R3B89_07880 [Polyangiaceae bacterium]
MADQSGGQRPRRCEQCGTLIGVERAGRMLLKYKTSQYLVRGEVMAVCRRCSAINETVVGPSREHVLTPVRG